MFSLGPLIAIDLGSYAIKVLELSRGQKKTLKKIGSERLPEGLIQDGQIKDVNTLTRSLARITKRLGILPRFRRVALGLSGSSAIIKKVNFPNKDELELADLIDAEAEQHFQHNLNDLYFTWQAFPAYEGTEQRAVLLVAAKRELVDQHMSIAKSVGFKIGTVDCAAFATQNMFAHNFGSPKGLYAVINLGHQASQLSLIENGVYLYTQDLPLGGASLTKALSQSLNLKADKAEALKLKASSGLESPHPKFVQAMHEANRQLAEEFRAGLDFFFQNFPGQSSELKLRGAFLNGGAAQTYHLDSIFSAVLGAPCRLINPFHRSELTRPYKALRTSKEALSYGVGFGLALQTYAAPL